MDTKHKVTVVIPVYDDWASLEKCLISLKKYLGVEHKVLLINDMGPNWEKIESQIKNEIAEEKNFYYEKNSENIGFVKTCNRAVYELDNTDNDILLLNSDTEVTEGFLEEMLHVLYLFNEHGVVCPRSNCATIYSVPSNYKDFTDLTPEKSYEVFNRIKDLLPRYQVMPTGIGFAMLIKRKLIRKFGLFDEIYSPGYNEENDFCMRITEQGYSCIAANKAYVFHYESKSFGGKREKLDLLHSRYLLNRYSYYPQLVENYLDYNIDPVDYFSAIIGGIYEKKRILIDISEASNTSSEDRAFALKFIDAFYDNFKNKYDIALLVDHDDDRLLNLDEKHSHIKVFIPEKLKENFDIAIVLSQITKTSHFQVISSKCLKYVLLLNSMGKMRNGNMYGRDYEKNAVFEQSLLFTNKIFYLNRNIKQEIECYYNRLLEIRGMNTSILLDDSIIQLNDEIIDELALSIEGELIQIFEAPIVVDVLYDRWRITKYNSFMYNHRYSMTMKLKSGIKKNLQKHPILYDKVRKIKRISNIK